MKIGNKKREGEGMKEDKEEGSRKAGKILKGKQEEKSKKGKKTEKDNSEGAGDEGIVK